MARYPVAPGIKFYSTFNVPGLPLNQSAIENDVTFFIVSSSARGPRRPLPPSHALTNVTTASA
jgi:hypothetical protein